ncbi:MAG: pitrilysin family protein [Ahrensia sp.]|nr:pitrilysin family protein [Ahrensia sp.]
MGTKLTSNHQAGPLSVRVIVTTALAFALIALQPIARVHAVEIQTVTSDAGIKALLVEDYTVPLIALSYSFKGGATQDIKGKEGSARLLTNMLDEGAADIESQAFQERLDDNGMKYSFSASVDSFSGSVIALKDSADESFELLRLMLNEPRFDEEPIERMKAARLNRLRSQETNPQSIAGEAFREAIFQGHPYERPADGTPETLGAISAADLEDFRKRVFARDNLIIGVVGAISADELKGVLDKVFGGLPEKAELKPVNMLEVETGKTIAIEFDTPQTNIRMALPGIRRDDPDFFAGYLVNYVLGGGAFSSRLYEEIREKRGLAYGVYSYLGTNDYAGFVGVGTATSAETTQKAIDLILAEIERMAKEGPTEEELRKAKDYIIGSYAISNLDTSGKIAGVLVAIQDADLGLDYIDRRRDYLEAVTIEDAKRVAKRLYSNPPTIVTVGKGVEAQN